MFGGNDDIFSMFGGGGGGGHPFESLFGGQMMGGRSRRRKGKTFMVPHEVTLAELYTGSMGKVNYDKDVICHKCRGAGGKPGAVQTCRECRGQGMVMKVVQSGPGMIMQTQSACSTCHGQGEQINEKDKCKVCNGSKVVKKDCELMIDVEPGMRHGQKIPFAGEADQHPDMDSGDVVVVLQQKPHDTIQRQKDDLFVEQKVTLTEALTGCSFMFTHLDGRKLIIRSPQGRVLAHECVKGLFGEGMPKSSQTGRGNLYFKFCIEFPEDNFASNENLKSIELFLPKRRSTYPMKAPDHSECVNMMELEGAKASYEDDEEHFDEESERPQGHSCQTS
ncbi:hypothetical protein LOD99_16027 [Oopsacas minuta]|uniref:CR-type domain-containing protein n=1 Tax=Oopsacas minuta TaxID=111878 RepID=A0AAV7K7I7_9METZ|nr:hypothetical protein LOD99_16027 [Oopsacas minuta]